MSYHFELDQAHKILRFRIEGEISDESLRESYRLLSKYCRLTDPDGGIFDMSAVTSVALSSRIIQMLSELPPAMPDAARPRVIVATDDCAFGMSRMFQLLGEPTRPNLHVVRTLEEAYAVLGVREPHFEPVYLDATEQMLVRHRAAG